MLPTARAAELIRAALDILRDEGAAALVRRMRLWLGGQRRHRAPAPHPMFAARVSTPEITASASPTSETSQEAVLPADYLVLSTGSANLEQVKAQGQEFVGYLRDFCNLNPGSAVLDVGCGVGRMAWALTDVLRAEQGGAYDGFDVVKAQIEACQSAIGRPFPHFRFTWANLYNKTYNPGGTVKAADFRFPYRDACYEVVLLTSVFTHMLPADVAHYWREIARVLKPGGSCLTTCFLLNPIAEAGIVQHRDELRYTFPVRYPEQRYAVQARREPEAAVAYEEAYFSDLVHASGLEVVLPVHHGWWSGREGGLSYQDIVLARKP